MTEHQELIQTSLKRMLELMGVGDTSLSIEDRNGHLFFNIKTADSKLLIGQYGQNLQALQHIVRLLVRKQVGLDAADEKLNFSLDVENYRREREEFLEALARKAASRVRETKQMLILKPMGSSDRKIIHALLSASSDLSTESIGDEPERRIVIKLRA